MTEIVFVNSGAATPHKKDNYFVGIFKTLWGFFSSQDIFTKAFVVTAVILAIIAPIFVARFFIHAAPTPASFGLEAEQSSLSGPVILGTDSLSSNGQYLLFQSLSATGSAGTCLVSPPAGVGVATATINVSQAGYYFVWSRIRGQGDSSNSYYLQIDNSCLIDVGDQNGMPSNTWTWVNFQNGDSASTIISNLSSGAHTVKLIGREANTSLDNLIFTTDATCSPTDTGSNCIAQTPVQPSATPTPTPPPGRKTASILVSPSSGTYTQGQTFSVDVKVDGGGTAFNAAQANVTLSSSLQVTDLTIPATSSGGCGFTWANNKNTPSITNLNFSGAILKTYSLGCTVYTVTLKALTTGTGTFTFTKGSVISYTTHKQILNSLGNGSYTLNPVPIPTPTPTLIPTPTPTPLPTLTPVPTPTPTGVPTPTPTPVPTPTPTPLPTPVPTPTPVVLQTPIINVVPTDTYDTSITLTGTIVSPVTTVNINGSSLSVTYPSSNTWAIVVNLSVGPNNFVVNGKDANGNISPSSSVTIINHIISDINGDGIIDLTDLSMFATDFENTGSLAYPLSDMNGDGVVDITDFSIIAQQYNGQ